MPFAKFYKKCRMKRLAQAFKLDRQQPVRFGTFEALGHSEQKSPKPWDPPCKRGGRPKYKRVTETLKDMWYNIRRRFPHTNQTFDVTDSLQRDNIISQIESDTPDPTYSNIHSEKYPPPFPLHHQMPAVTDLISAGGNGDSLASEFKHPFR